MGTQNKKCLLRRSADGLRRDASGIAATEFAMLLPVMVLLFFGMLETSDAFTVDRRVSQASNAIVDLVGQAEKTTPAEIDNIFTGAQRILEPNDISTLDFRLTSVIRYPSDPDKTVVQWSRDHSGGEPYAIGSEFALVDDEDILIPGVSVLVAEASYDFTSGISNRILGQPISFNKTTKRWPRLVSEVLLCPNNAPDCDAEGSLGEHSSTVNN